MSIHERMIIPVRSKEFCPKYAKADREQGCAERISLCAREQRSPCDMSYKNIGAKRVSFLRQFSKTKWSIFLKIGHKQSSSYDL